MGEFFAAQRADGERAFPLSAPLSARIETAAFEIPGNSTSTATIAVGGVRADTLEVAGDEDWFRLTLTAGQSVTIELTGTGASPLSDPFLWLYDSSGTLVTYNDDGGPGLGSLIEFTASASGTHFVAADSYGGLYAGDYRLAVAPVLPQADSIPGSTASRETIALGGTAAERIDYLGDADWFRLSLSDGQAAVLEVSGTGADPLYDPVIRVYDPSGRLLQDFDDGSGYSSSHRFVAPAGGTYFVEVASYGSQTIGDYVLTATETDPPRLVDSIRGVTRLDATDPVLVYFSRAGDTYSVEGTSYTATGFNTYETDQLWSVIDGIESFAGIDFQHTTNRAAADIEWGSTDLGGTLMGFFMYPDSAGAGGIGLLNDASLGWKDSPGGGLDAGGFMYGVAIHEFGHALGLGHTHDGGNGTVAMNGVSSTTDLGDFELNQTVFTAMSYNDGWHSNPDGRPGTYNYGYASSFGAIDIAALQEIYGVNTTSRGGDDVYNLAGGNAPGVGYATIWDTGGTDEIRYGGSGDAVIDLRAATLQYEVGGGGFISRVSGVFGGFTIAAGAVIENARAGGGDDVLTGNAADNVLIGGDGTDTLAGGGGADRLEGGSGDDRLTGGSGADTFRFGSGHGADSIVDFEIGIDVIDLIQTGTTFGQLAISDGTGGAVVAYAGTRTATTSRIEVAGVAAAQLSERDFLTAVAGPPPIIGTESADLLIGTDGDDELQGLAGDDVLAGGAGADRLVGGAGIDTADYSDATATVYVRLYDGVTDYNGQFAGARGDSLSGIENLVGGAAGDYLLGDAGANRLDGGAGGDYLDGKAGDDVLIGGAGADWLDGGAGIDTADYSDATATVYVRLYDNATDYNGQFAGARGDVLSGIENLVGGSAGDYLLGDAAANWLDGGAGGDYLDGKAGDDVLIGGAGADWLDGGAGIDTADYSDATATVYVRLYDNATDYNGQFAGARGDVLSGIENLVGGSAGDYLLGDAAANRLAGGAGNDYLYGKADDDVLIGGAGADWLIGGAGADWLDGGAGIDTADYSDATATVYVRLYDGVTDYNGQFAGARGDALSGIENLAGGAAGDYLLGDAAANRLAGGAGDDYLDGKAGDDVLIGGAGADWLIGGAGIDRFAFGDGSGQDAIIDFAVGDVIDLSAASALQNFADVQAAVSQIGGNSLIDLGGGSNVTLQDYLATDLSEDDFLF